MTTREKAIAQGLTRNVPDIPLEGAVIEATISKGFLPASTEGKPLRMALIDSEGRVVEAGDHVAWAAWKVCIQAQHNFWKGQGHLVVHAGPPQAADKKAAA